MPAMRTLIAMALATLALPPLVGAEEIADRERRVAVLDLRGDGLDEQALAFFRAGVLTGVNRVQIPVEPKRITDTFAALPRLKGCLEDECLLALARATQARYVLTSEVTRTVAAPKAAPPSPGKKKKAKAEPPPAALPDYTIRLRLFDSAVSEITSSDEGTCAACTEETAHDRCTDVAVSLFERARHPPSFNVTIDSKPPGDRVRVDGRWLGVTPLALGLAAGAHKFAVERGDKSATSQLVLARGPLTLRAEFGREAKLIEEALPAAPIQTAAKTGAAPIDQLRLVSVPDEPPKEKPIYKRTWFQGAAGGVGALIVIVSVGVGIAYAVPNNAPVPETTLGSQKINF